MPTLIKRHGSPYWIAAFDVPLPDGGMRRLKLSTKRTKKADAAEEAMRLESSARKEAGATTEHNPEAAARAYAILRDAAEAAARGELSEARARELIARLAEASTGQPLRFYTLETWAADWLAHKASVSKPATVIRYRGSVGAFLAFMGERAKGRLETVTKSDIRAFRDAVRSGSLDRHGKTSPRTAKTANGYVADVAGMFRAAVREGLILASPAAALEKLPEDDSTERQVLTLAEIARLIEAAGKAGWIPLVFSRRGGSKLPPAGLRKDWPGVILCGFYGGLRLGNAARLTWANIDTAAGVLSFTPAKTSRKRKRLEIPIHPRLAAYFATLKRGGDSDPVFKALARVRVSGKHGLSGQFAGIMAAAKVDRRTMREGKPGLRAMHARSFHSLRHSLTSSLANLDVAEEIRRRIVGHDSPEIHAAYTHHERETLARAVAKLPSV